MGDDPRSRVLVVEDEPDLAELYADWLSADHEVEVCYEGAEAIERLDGSVDVALLDRRIPDRSGDEVLAEIRRRELDCRVAMVTAVKPAADIIEMGFDDYLVKPVSRADLRTVVERLLRRSEHTELVRELFALASKKAVLEAAGSVADERLSDLQRSFEDTVEAVEASSAELEPADYEVLFYDLKDEAFAEPPL